MWWDNFVNEVLVPEKLKENFRIGHTVNAFGVELQTVSKIVGKLCTATGTHQGTKYINLYFIEPEVEELLSKFFYQVHEFPQSTGAIDESHIADEDPTPVFLLGDPANSLMPHLMKEYASGVQHVKNNTME